MQANTIIASALRSLLVIPSGGTPTTNQYADGLEVLNDGIKMWSAQNNMVYEDTVENLTIPSGTQSITIGATGTLVTARPHEITVATLKSGNNRYPMAIIDSRQYQRFSDLTNVGQPFRIYYRKTYPNGTLYFESTTDTEYTLDLTSIKSIDQFTDGTTDNQLPEHYETALKHNLKLWLADEMGRGASVTPLMIQFADESKKTIIAQALDITTSAIEISRSGRYSIEADAY